MEFLSKIGSAIVAANDFVNGIVWGVPLLVLIFATGIYFTARPGFVQCTRPRFLFRETILKAFQKKDDGEKTP